MPLPEYANLTKSELELADHYADIGDTAALRQFQEVSAKRGRHPLNEKTYHNPMQLRRRDEI